MSKYNPLAERLSGHAEEEWRASFAELEEVLGFPLPKGARGGRAWWSNTGDKPHSRAWTATGWQVGEVDPGAERVMFRRHAELAAGAQPQAMKEAAETASNEMHAKRAAGAGAIVALAAGVGLAVIRAVMRRR